MLISMSFKYASDTCAIAICEAELQKWAYAKPQSDIGIIGKLYFVMVMLFLVTVVFLYAVKRGWPKREDRTRGDDNG